MRLSMYNVNEFVCQCSFTILPTLLSYFPKGVFQASPVDLGIDLAELDNKIQVNKHRLLKSWLVLDYRSTVICLTRL